MSRKNNLQRYHVFDDVSMGASVTQSPVTSIAYLDNIGAQFNWTGAGVGTFSVEVSADYMQDFNGNISDPGNWTPLTFTYWDGAAFVTDTSIPTSVGSPIYLDLAFLSAPWIRLVYTRTSGTGTLNAWLTGKML